MEAILQISGFTRRSLAWVCGVAGLLVYNWWALVPFKHGLLRSPSELFSNLEVTGRPYAIAMQRADVTAGVLLLVAFLLTGSKTVERGRREWLCLVVFAMAGAIGGLFPQVCADALNHSCMSEEWHFQLAASQYVHDGSGVIEFAAITLALLLAIRRTRRKAYKILGWGAVVAYPVLGVTYLVNIDGSIVEAVFFAGFSVIVLLQLAERLSGHQSWADHNDGMMGRWEQMSRPPAPR